MDASLSLSSSPPGAVRYGSAPEMQALIRDPYAVNVKLPPIQTAAVSGRPCMPHSLFEIGVIVGCNLDILCSLVGGYEASFGDSLLCMDADAIKSCTRCTHACSISKSQVSAAAAVLAEHTDS